jgi:anti-sigma factor RsiW
MNCQDVRAHLLDSGRGRLAPALQEDVRLHVESCAACAHEEAAERLLSTALEERLPQHAAPLALKRRLAASWPVVSAPRSSWWSRWGRSVVPATAVAVVLLALTPVAYRYSAGSRLDPRAMVTEAVNDHLRILSSQHPLDIESGGMHEVKPWFEGRLDFAPVVPFLGDADFPLQGGAVGYFLDRKAAVFVFRRRLHAISLFVFRAEDLPWPGGPRERLAGVQAYRTTARGFNLVLWRHEELGYALVSDLDAGELGQLAVRLVAEAR